MGYTTEQVETLLYNLYNDLHGLDSKEEIEKFNQWIEENLKNY